MPKGKFSQKENKKSPAPIKPKTKKTAIEYFAPKKGRPKSLAIIPEIVKPIAKIEEIVAAFKKYQEIKKELQAEGDIVIIRDKECSTRVFDNKLAKFFGISVDIVRVMKEVNKNTGVFSYKVWAKAIAPSGQFRVAGAACRSDERNFAHLEHDVLAQAETRAKKRAIEELVGFGQTLPKEDYEEK